MQFIVNVADKNDVIICNTRYPGSVDNRLENMDIFACLLSPYYVQKLPRFSRDSGMLPIGAHPLSISANKYQLLLNIVAGKCYVLLYYEPYNLHRMRIFRYRNYLLFLKYNLCDQCFILNVADVSGDVIKISYNFLCFMQNRPG